MQGAVQLPVSLRLATFFSFFTQVLLRAADKDRGKA